MARPGRGIAELLDDLIEWGEKAAKIASEHPVERYETDEVVRLALAKALEVVGEICGRLLRLHPDWCTQAGDTNLRNAYRLRNRISHGYGDIDWQLIRQVALKDLPLLLDEARQWRIGTGSTSEP